MSEAWAWARRMERRVRALERRPAGTYRAGVTPTGPAVSWTAVQESSAVLRGPYERQVPPTAAQAFVPMPSYLLLMVVTYGTTVTADGWTVLDAADFAAVSTTLPYRVTVLGRDGAGAGGSMLRLVPGGGDLTAWRVVVGREFPGATGVRAVRRVDGVAAGNPETLTVPLGEAADPVGTMSVVLHSAADQARAEVAYAEASRPEDDQSVPWYGSGATYDSARVMALAVTRPARPAAAVTVKTWRVAGGGLAQFSSWAGGWFVWGVDLARA